MPFSRCSSIVAAIIIRAQSKSCESFCQTAVCRQNRHEDSFLKQHQQGMKFVLPSGRLQVLSQRKTGQDGVTMKLDNIFKTCRARLTDSIVISFLLDCTKRQRFETHLFMMNFEEMHSLVLLFEEMTLVNIDERLSTINTNLSFEFLKIFMI